MAGEVRYCGCGERIWIEWRPNAFKDVPMLFDQDGYRITQCPGCGQVLEEGSLRRQPEAEDDAGTPAGEVGE
jgi:hypothetical protein